MTMRTVTATRYVTPLREGGSLPGLVEADDDGLYVVKFRGAGQGPRALVAEWLAGELARAIGLAVPDLVAVDLDPALGAAEPDEEVHDLLAASAGLNLGMDFLPGALTFNPAVTSVGDVIEPDTAADVVWLDAFVTNPDRTAVNPNLLVWHGRPWLIDHGAALYIHHTWRDPDAHARGAFERIADHVLLPYASSIEAADDRKPAGSTRRWSATWFRAAGVVAAGRSGRGRCRRPARGVHAVPGGTTGATARVRGGGGTCPNRRVASSSTRSSGSSRASIAARASMPGSCCCAGHAGSSAPGSPWTRSAWPRWRRTWIRPRSDRTSRRSNVSPRAIRPEDPSPRWIRRNGSTGWSRRPARSSSHRTSIPGCATTRRPSSTTWSPRSSTGRVSITP